jgi:hypothetical protein
MKLWGVSWLEIETHWTDDQYFAFVDRAGERLKREHKSSGGNKGGKGGGNSVSSASATQTLIKKFNDSKARKPEQIDGT